MRIDQLAYSITCKNKKLIPVVVQDYVTREVLMLAYANAETLKESIRTGFAHYWSRSRREAWKKGQTSGNVQEIVEILADCDADALLYRVKQTGSACHLGRRSCFSHPLDESVAATRRWSRSVIRQIVQAYARSPVVERKWHGKGIRPAYKYIVNPLTENTPPPDPLWSEWIACKIHEQTENGADKVVTAESLGLPIAQLVASLKGKPLAVARKRNLHENSSLLAKARYASDFEHGTYWIHGVSERDKVLVIDDAISTGGTLVALLAALKENGVVIKDVFCVFEKPEYHGVRNLKQATGIRVKTLFRIDTRTRKCVPTKYARALK